MLKGDEQALQTEPARRPVTELEILRRRRELVVLSAELQRATVVRRLDRVPANPAAVALRAARARQPCRCAQARPLLSARAEGARIAARSLRRHARRSAVRTALKTFPVPILPSLNRKETHMLYWAAVFFIVALIAAVLGFGGIAAGAAGIAKILFFIFLVAFVVSLLMGVFRRSV